MIPPPAAKFRLPDMLSLCGLPAYLNRHHKKAVADSAQWFIRGSDLKGKKLEAFLRHKVPSLGTRCYPTAAYPQVRVASDLLIWIFYIDDIAEMTSEEENKFVADDVANMMWDPHGYEPVTLVAKMASDFWKRVILTIADGARVRFIEAMDAYLRAIAQQARDRDLGYIPDVESYMALRRGTGGCRVCWALIEYASNLDIPAEVMNHPSMLSMSEIGNDGVVLANDIFSFNVEQSRADDHNLIVVIMHQEKVDVQTAMDIAGDMFKENMDRFFLERDNLPSWGPEIDKQVDLFVDGLGYWISGNINWSFETERYFGTANAEVKKTRLVNLLPRTGLLPTAYA